MQQIKLWGYTIYENGTIIGKNGKELSHNRQLKILWGNGGKPRFITRSRFIYYAFNYKTFNVHDKTLVVQHKNGDNNDYNINNLIVVKRKSIQQGEHNVMAKLTDAQIEEIKALYNQSKDKRVDKNDPFAKISYRKLAEKYNVSHSTIAGIIKGQFRNKDNYIL